MQFGPLLKGVLGGYTGMYWDEKGQKVFGLSQNRAPFWAVLTIQVVVHSGLGWVPPYTETLISVAATSSPDASSDPKPQNLRPKP